MSLSQSYDLEIQRIFSQDSYQDEYPEFYEQHELTPIQQ